MESLETQICGGGGGVKTWNHAVQNQHTFHLSATPITTRNQFPFLLSILSFSSFHLLCLLASFFYIYIYVYIYLFASLSLLHSNSHLHLPSYQQHSTITKTNSPPFFYQVSTHFFLFFRHTQQLCQRIRERERDFRKLSCLHI